jgi:NADPH:quinone reductase-like Zn-dependent oxidoreductase
MSTSMQRWQLMGAGRQHLELTRAPVPQPQRGEVLVRVSAVSLNFRDHLITQGLYAPDMALPLTPGSDMAGVVAAVGEGVQRFAAGDRVMGSFTGPWLDGPPDASLPVLGGVGGPGVLAQYVVLPESWLVASPASLDDAAASTLPCAALTAWNALFDLGSLKPGQTVLLQGTGGVSLFALQLARGAGAQVIITSSSEGKLARARELGATHGIVRDAGGEWAKQALALTGGRGVDHVLELAAGDNLRHSLAALKPGGRISLIGVFEGFEARAPLMPMFQKQAVIQGLYIGSRNGLDRLARAVDTMQLKPVIEQRYAFGELPQALAHVERGAFGKVVVELPH